MNKDPGYGILADYYPAHALQRFEHGFSPAKKKAFRTLLLQTIQNVRQIERTDHAREMEDYARKKIAAATSGDRGWANTAIIACDKLANANAQLGTTLANLVQRAFSTKDTSI